MQRTRVSGNGTWRLTEVGVLGAFGAAFERFQRQRRCSRRETTIRCAFGGGAVPILGLGANSGRLAMSPSTCG